jgi:hypothetical protein
MNSRLESRLHRVLGNLAQVGEIRGSSGIAASRPTSSDMNQRVYGCDSCRAREDSARIIAIALARFHYQS